MNNPTRILIVEDLPADYDLAQREIRKVVGNCEFKRVEKEKEFLQALEIFQPALILSDYELPGFNGLKALELAQKHAPAIPFLIWSGVISEDAAVESMKKGASNYIFKENLKRLGPAVAHALEERKLLLEHKQAEETVKNSERRFRALIENGLDSISLLAADGSLLWESPAITPILDFAPGEFLGRSLFKLMHPDDMAWTQSVFSKLLKEPGSRQHNSFRLRHSDGTWRWVEAVVTNMLDEPGVEAIVVNYRDITERRQAEDALRESREKYRLLFQNNPLPMWIYDLETLKFLKVNDAAVTCYGYSMEDFLAMTIKDIRPALDVPMLLENIATSATRGNQQIDNAGIWRHCKKDGTVILVDIISHPVELDGRKGELVLAHDVTRQKQAESEIQQRNDDLALINSLNEVINRGLGLDAVVKLLWAEAKRIFSSEYTTIYLLSPDGKSLKMQQYFLPSGMVRKIEKLIGRTIPPIEIPIQEGGLFHSVLLTGHGTVTSAPKIIQSWIGEFVETSFLPGVARGTIRKLIPQIYKLLNIKSTLLIPLISDGKTLGFLNVSGSHILTEQDLKRLENIGSQLTTALRRQQVEDELKAERNLLRTLIDNLPDRIYVMDNDGRKTISNTADWKASGGQTMEDVIGRTDFDTYPPDLAEQFWQVDRAVIDSGQPVIDYEEPGLDFEGNRVSILTTKIPLRHEDGRVVGLVGIGRDITERKQVEARINDLLAFNEKILNNSPVGILTYKATGECVFASEKAALMIGATVEVLKAQNFMTIESWRKSGLYDLIRKAITTQAPVSSDIHVVSTFGKDIWMTVHCVTFKSKEEDLVLLSISDISTRKASEIERQALLEIMQGLANTDDLQEFLKLIHGAIARVIYAENLFVVFHQQESGLFQEIYTVDQYDPPAPPSSLEKSVTSYVFRTGEPLLLTQERFDELAAQGEVDLVGTNSASWLGAPLKTLNGTIGVIAVQNYEDRHCYTEHDKDFLASIATQVALAIERKRAEDAEREQRALAEALRDTAQTLNSTLDYGEVLDHILTAVGRVVPHDAATIMLIDGDSAHVVRLQDYDKHSFYDEIMGIRLPLAQTTNLRQMLETRKTVIVPDTHAYMGWKRLPVTDWLRSSVGAPISISGEVIGFILLDSETIGFFTPVHAERLEAFASQAALAIHNARLLQQAQKEIADRRLAEDALRESEALYRQAIEVAGAVPYYQSYYDNGKSIKYEFIGQGIRQITGYGPEEFNARVWDSLVEEVNLVEDLTGYSLDEGIERVRSGANPIWKCEHRIRDRDGKIHWVFEAAVEIRDENGISGGSIGTYQDITERKQAEIELRASEERFRQLANNIEEVFWMTDAQSGKELYMSPAAEKVWGRSLDYLMLEPNAFINIVLPEDQPEVLHALQREKDGEKVELEYRVVDADGSIRWIWDRAFPIFGEDGRVRTLAGIAADITDRKKAEFETRRYLVELEALYENGLAVGQLLEPEKIGNRMIETFAHHLSWHHVAIRLLRPDTDELDLVAFNLPGLSDKEKQEMRRHLNKMIHKVGEGISGWVIQNGEPFRTGDVHAHPQYVDTHAGILSGLYMPLKIGDRTIGCISVESEQSDAFSAQDERLLATLANQAAIAFENARLYNTAQQELLERKRAQDALSASETHYRALADSITDILFEIDYEQHYTHWNKASEMLTGIASEDAIGRSMRQIFGESEEQTQIGEIYESVLQSRQAKTFETEMVVQGQQRAFEVNAYPSMRGVAVVAKDVTERKLAETLMQKRLELMDYSARHSIHEVMQRTIDEVSELTASHIGFFHFVEPDQITLGMQTWSTNARRLFHVSVSDGTHLPLDQAGVWAEAARQRRPLIHNDYQSLLQKKDLPEGHVAIMREMVIPIMRNGKIVAIMGIGNKPQDYTQHDLEAAERLMDYAWDITERKQMESALADERNQLARRIEERTADLSRANSNLARALIVKDEFLANMSHELRTPLNAILGLSESLGEQVAGPLNEKQQKYLTTINESGHHLLSLINDILDLAKIEAGQITLDIHKVDVNSVCQASLRMIKQLAQKKDQEVIFETDRGLGLMWADERRLKQMIVNLLSNAVKFTPEAGKIGLEVRGDRAGNKVILTVWDNGMGISERDMNRLFRPFVQLDAGLAREATGTGLGLALVAQMARLHGGSVNVTSQPGEGSRFSIQLPWEPALVADPAARLRSTGKFQAIDPNAKNKPTILLIEDTREVVMMLTDYLEMTGFKVVTAQDGVDGLTQAKLSHPDLILMDIQMPRMDGFEATKRLRSDPEFKDTPIIALTALAMPNDRQLCLEAGMDEYMSKPVNLKGLVKTLRKFLLENKETNP
ncbi:MAG: PAS domain S-box protein [Chloroflexota bacterium]